MKKEQLLAFVSMLGEVEESPHFDKLSFSIKKKNYLKIDEAKNSVTVKLTPEEQSAFMAFDKSIIYPASGKWGKDGWTIIDLEKVNSDTLADAVRCSYCNVAPKKLADQFRADF